MKFIENLFLCCGTPQRSKIKKITERRELSNLQRAPQFHQATKILSPSCWSRGLRSGSAATRLLGVRVRIPPEACMSFAFECCVLSCRGLWDGPITNLEDSWWVCCFWMWSWNLSKEEWTHEGCRTIRKKLDNFKLSVLRTGKSEKIVLIRQISKWKSLSNNILSPATVPTCLDIFF